MHRFDAHAETVRELTKDTGAVFLTMWQQGADFGMSPKAANV